MGGASSSGSFLANSVKRREQLNKTRQALLDQPGIPRRGGPPPPTAPAQGRKSPQQQATTQRRGEEAPVTRGEEGQIAPSPTRQEKPADALNLDPETRQELLEMIEPFILQAKKEKKAKLHRRIGRSRKFWGGGL